MIEDVVDRAVVIGAFTWPYEFWTRDGKRQIGKRMLFESDKKAEDWVRENFPTEYYAQGFEMRRFAAQRYPEGDVKSD